MNVRLLVLGLLADQPRHGYEIRKLAEENRIEAWTGILPGSIYHALRQLAKERLIALEEREHHGERTRDVYRITKPGRAALQTLIKEAWTSTKPALPTDLYGAVLFRQALSAAEEAAAIEQRIAALAAEIEQWERARPLKGPMTAPEAALFDNGLAHLRTDLNLLRRLDALGHETSGRGSRRRARAR